MANYLSYISVRRRKASSVDIACLSVMLLVLNLDFCSTAQTRSFDSHDDVGMSVVVESGKRVGAER